MNYFEASVKNQWFINDQELMHVVKKMELLEQAIVYTESMDGYAEYSRLYDKMSGLLRALVKTEITDVVLCKAVGEYCWIIELDYLDDGVTPLTVVSWPSIEELIDEDIQSIVGQTLEIVKLKDILEEDDPIDEFNDFLDELLGEDDFLEEIGDDDTEDFGEKSKQIA